jgi:V/A-type H+-transporting ATPase subunit E
MSLEVILAAILAAGDAQVTAIATRAQQEAEALLAGARQEGEQVRQATRERVTRPAYRERARIIHRARLTRLRTIGDVREAAVDAALEQARFRLAQVRFDPGYPDILSCLVQQALAELRGSLEDVRRARLEADPRDEELLVRILRDMNLDLAVGYRLECWGGVIARSEDGRIVVINTLESRLERAMPFLRRYLAALFEEGETIRPLTITEMPAYER